MRSGNFSILEWKFFFDSTQNGISTHWSHDSFLYYDVSSPDSLSPRLVACQVQFAAIDAAVAEARRSREAANGGEGGGTKRVPTGSAGKGCGGAGKRARK